MLGISVEGVRQLYNRGKIGSIRDAQGRHLFARAEVLELARIRGRPKLDRLDGDIAAKCFEMFDMGMELPAIVQATHQSPQMVRTLYAEYCAPLREKKARVLDEHETKDAAAAFVAAATRKGARAK